MKIVFFVALMLISYSGAQAAESIHRIQVGSDYKKYSHSDLQKRVWELEQAVAQLQSRVFQLEAGHSPVTGAVGSSATAGSTSATVNTPDSWLCTIDAMGETYSGSGGSKAVAADRAIQSCKAGRGDGFFCKDPKCEQ